jgi:hypothetical protein
MRENLTSGSMGGSWERSQPDRSSAGPGPVRCKTPPSRPERDPTRQAPATAPAPYPTILEAILVRNRNGMATAGSQRLVDEPTAVAARAVRTSADTPASGAELPDCSIYYVPTLESGLIPRSLLSDGLAHVIVCKDSAGREVLNEQFVHRQGD